MWRIQILPGVMATVSLMCVGCQSLTVQDVLTTTSCVHAAGMYTARHDDEITVKTVVGSEAVLRWAVVLKWPKGCGPQSLDAASIGIECDGDPAWPNWGISMKQHVWWVVTYKTDKGGEEGGHALWGRKFACNIVAEVGGLDPKRIYVTCIVDIYEDGTSKYTRQ